MPEDIGTATEGGTQPNEGGTTGTNQSIGWRAGLPESLRNHEAFQAMGKVGDLGKAYLDQSDKLQRAVMIPGENAPPEERKAFLQKLGVPERPEDYEISTEDASFNDHFRKAAHEQGLSKEQAKALASTIETLAKSQVQQAEVAQKQQRTQEREKLRQEWGASADANEAAARRFLLIAGEDLSQPLAESGMVEDPRVLRGLHKLSKMISEDHLVTGSGSQQQSGWRFDATPGM